MPAVETEPKIYFEAEAPKCQKTGIACKQIFVVRGYKCRKMARYFLVVTVVKRENDYWEPTAWMTNNHAPKNYQTLGLDYLIGLGLKISGTFELHRLKAYRRFFRKHYTLKLIEKKQKMYGGKFLHLAYVEFIKKQG